MEGTPIGVFVESQVGEHVELSPGEFMEYIYKDMNMREPQINVLLMTVNNGKRKYVQIGNRKEVKRAFDIVDRLAPLLGSAVNKRPKPKQK